MTLEIEVDRELNFIKYNLIKKSKLIKSIYCDSPELVWNCNCHVDRNKYSVLPCYIHSNLDADFLSVYGNKTLISYSGVKVIWLKSENTRPSIDSFLLLQFTLKWLKTHKIISVLDFACGSGMIGICLKKMFPFIKIDFYDRDKKELKSSYDNYLINSLEKKSAHFYEISSFEKKKYDFIISNPPYLPYNLLNYTSEEFKKSSVFNQNMEHEFFNLINQTKYCLFNISSINRITEKILARKFGRFKIVYNYSVPLRIPALFTENNSFILEEMVKLKLIIPVKNSYHPFYHLINGFLFY
jgi:16S rRNA G966 N2-methylase RsmD